MMYEVVNSIAPTIVSELFYLFAYHFYLLSKEKLNNGSPTTVRVGYVKTIYLI